MRVLHITTNYPTKAHPIYGIFVKEQIESLNREGIDTTVYFSNSLEISKTEHIKSIWRIFKHLIKNEKYDVIHCHHAISGIILVLSGGALFNKCILSYQNDPTREYGKKWFRFLYPFFNKIIVKNKSEYLKYKKLEYLPNGTNSYFFRPMNKLECRRILGLDENKIYIVYMDSNAGVRTQKRHDRYIETINLLNQRFDNIESLELTNTPRELIPMYFNACDVHLLTSDFEGSPNSIKECLCCNTPIVSTDVGNVRLMAGDIPGCVVTEEFTPEALADGVISVLNYKGNFYGREMFLSKGYDIGTVAKKLIGIYQDVSKK